MKMPTKGVKSIKSKKMQIIIFKLATSEIANILGSLCSCVAGQAGLGMTWSETPMASFLTSRPIYTK